MDTKMNLLDDISHLLDTFPPSQLEILQRAHDEGATVVIYSNLASRGVAAISPAAPGEYIGDWLEKQLVVDLELTAEAFAEMAKKWE
jgi:hypothetical protein